MSEFLYGYSPLVLDRCLGLKVGIVEAALLQQITFWITVNEDKGKNKHDGYYWTYNTIEAWQEELMLWHKNTIANALTRLEKMGLIVVGNYNKMKQDRTRWFRIDAVVYAALVEEIRSDRAEKIQEKEKSSKSDNGAIHKNCEMQNTATVSALPENSTEKRKNVYDSPESHECEPSKLYPIVDNANLFPVIDYFWMEYYHKIGYKHPRLASDQFTRVYFDMRAFAENEDVDYETWVKMIDLYFSDKNLVCDHHVNHFASEEIMMNRWRDVT